MNIDKQEVSDLEWQEVLSLVSRSSDQARDLLRGLSRAHKNPFDAMLVSLLATVVLAKAIGMSREDLLEGVQTAFNALKEATQHATH